VNKRKCAEDNLKKTLYSIIGDNSFSFSFDAQIQFNFFPWDQNLVGFNQFIIPDIFLSDEIAIEKSIADHRSIIDLCCCYYLFCDIDWHNKEIINSKNPYLHNQFEKIRVILLGSNRYLGFAKNISQKISEDFESATKLDIIALILFDAYFSQILLQNIKYSLGLIKSSLDSELVRKIIDLLQFLGDQKRFFAEVANIIDILQQEEDDGDELNDEKNQQEQQKKDENNNSQQNQQNIADYKEEKLILSEEDVDNLPKKSPEVAQEQKKYLEDAKKTESLSKKIQSPPAIKLQNDYHKLKFIDPYKIFTTRFDEILQPQKIIKKEELQKLRDQLDKKFCDLKQISRSIEIKLKKKLLSKKDYFLEMGASSGILNRKKLTQLIVNPLVNNILIDKRFCSANNVAVTILLDNSGSMRGKPIIMSALACQILAEILEKFFIKSEIIGYTTRDWKGGRARILWQEGGKPKNPGRLNELRHIIYKDFKQSLKSVKNNLALMLKEGILKENIDGEAILFAIKRLNQRSEKRKILLIISDGNPIDDSTNSTNDKDILLNHLQNVVENIDKRKDIELASIAIGYSSDRFYKNSISIKDVSEIGDVMMDKVLQFL